MKRKSLIIPVMLTCVMLLNGCGAKSIDDIYSMASTEATTAEYVEKEPKWHDYMLYEKLPDGKELPELQEAGEKIDVSEWSSKLWATVEEAVITDNFNDIKDYTDEDSAEKIYEYAKKVYPGYINEDGTFGIGRRGVAQKGLIIKYHIYKSLHKAGQVVLKGHIQHCVRDGIEHGDADKTIANFTKAVEHFAIMH